MALCWEFTKNGLWNLVRMLFVLFRSLFWLLTCTCCRRCCSRRVGAYEKSAHVMKIWARHKLDLVLQPSGPDNFIAVHKCFENPEYVLADNVTLYYVNKDEAVFVETEPGIDVTKSEYGAFVRIAQFKMAKKLVILPISVFHQLAEKVGPPKGKIIFVSNTTRCGSTLLTQVFEETGKSVAYSEPDAMNALTQLVNEVSEKQLELIIKHSVNLLCKPLKEREITSYVLKLTQPTMVATPYLAKLYPEAYHLFMYRDGLKVAKSLSRAAFGMPLLGLLLVIGKKSPKLTKKMVVKMGLPADQFEQKVLSPIHFCSIVWAAAIRQYLDFRDQGINIAGVRYEDMVDDAKHAFSKIFEKCDIPFDEEAVDKAFSRDSQRDSPLSMKNLNKHKLEEFTPEVKQQTDAVCNSFGVACFPEVYIAPGTITYKGDVEVEKVPNGTDDNINQNGEGPKQNGKVNVTFVDETVANVNKL